MVMSGSGERVVFVHGRPGDEAWLTGGTIARLHSDGSHSLVLFAGEGGPESHDDAAITAALGELGGDSWRWLSPPSEVAGGPQRGAVDDAIEDALAAEWATAVVVGELDEDLRAVVIRAASAAGLPVFVSRRVSDAAAQRLVAIDVSDQVDQKIRALGHYPGRWPVRDGFVSDRGGLSVSGTEAFARIDAPRPKPVVVPSSTALSRAVAGVLGLVAGVMFGVLGTLAHQADVTVGSVHLPVGLVIAVVAVGSLLTGLRLVFGDRSVALMAAVGLLVTIFVLSLRGVGGSVLVPAGLPGTLWTVVPTLLAALVLAWPKIPTRH